MIRAIYAIILGSPLHQSDGNVSMSKAEPDDVREIGSPVRFFGAMGDPDGYDKDFSPRAVSSDDVHPSEVEADPKALTSSATGLAEIYSDLIPESPEENVSVAPETPHDPPVEPESLEDLPLPSSSTSTKNGVAVPPVLPSAPPTIPTSSSPGVVK